jgi:uncharacterized protein (TIGR00255 family)
MTAFGRSQAKSEWGLAIWELRSVNHRYLEMSIRLPEVLRELEPSIREIIHQYFLRGKIECTLKFFPGPKLAALVNINYNLLDQLLNLATEVGKKLPSEMTRFNVAEFLSWQGVVVEESFDISSIREELLTSFRQAADDLKEGRKREGRVLATIIEEKLNKMASQVKKIEQQLPKLLERQREKIIQRLEEVKVNLDPQRLEQEMVYFTQKVDIAEEIDRTISHLAEVNRALQRGDSAGRHLDFMMQELNREANTIASKSADTLVTHAAVEMKVLIEQIREQVQNIE